jgi:Ca-activated chloride channel family protein
MRKVLLCSGLVLALPLVAFQQSSPPSPRAQQSGPIRVEVEAVNVLVSVLDKQGRFVTDLTPDRFVVIEDRVRQQITNFAKDTSLPLTIALMIDTSGSVRLALDFEKSAASTFFHEVMRPQDQAMLVEFDTGATLLHDFTDRPNLLVEQLRGLRSGGGTALFDALTRVASEKLTQATERRAIVIVSDGNDLNSKHTLDEAAAAVLRSEATVYAIGTTNFGTSRDEGGEKKLRSLCDLTGGRLFLPSSEGQFEEAFSLINQELRSQYSLTYVPTNKARDGVFRKLKIEIIGKKGLKIRHKEGYYALLEEKKKK